MLRMCTGIDFSQSVVANLLIMQNSKCQNEIMKRNLSHRTEESPFMHVFPHII